MPVGVSLKIAVIGWGSLIWKVEPLSICGGWHKDGPSLPIEFARMSGDGRLTLVIHSGAREVPTYWAESVKGDMESARENLRIREGAPTVEPIRGVTAGDEVQRDDPVGQVIMAWLVNKAETVDLEGVVWTALKSKWTKDVGPFTLERGIAYLVELERNMHAAAETYRSAREYICNAPPQTQTSLREAARKQLGWADANPPTTICD
jgi:hypothetical protein